MRFAREHDLLVSVRGGGHSAGGRAVCQGGLMIDLSPMTDVRVDPTRRTAIAQPGVKLGESDQAAQAFGLATTSGVASDTGIAGLTLGADTAGSTANTGSPAVIWCLSKSSPPTAGW